MLRFFRVYCLFGFLFGSLSLGAQTKVNFDSLRTIIDRYPTEDTVKARMLINFANDIRKTDQIRGLAAAEQAIALAESLHQPLLVADAFVVKGLNLFNQRKQLEGLALLEQAYQAYLEIPNELKAAMTALRRAELHDNRSEYENELECSKLAEKLLLKLKNNVELARCYRSLGSAHVQLSENEQGLSYLNKSFQLYQSLNDSLGMMKCYNDYGFLYSRLANWNKSTEYHLKALAIGERLKNVNLGSSYSNIANNFSVLYDNTKALEYHNKALEFFKRNDNKINIGGTYVNIGNVYIDLKDYNKALEYNLLAKDILESINAQQFLATCISNIGLIHTNLKQYEQAYIYCMDALKRFEQLGFISSKTGLIKIYVGQIIYLSSPDELQKMGIEQQDAQALAEKYTLEGIDIAQESGAIDTEHEGYHVLSLIQEQAGDYINALKSFQRYVTLRDSISSEDILEQITRKEIQYEFDKKEANLKFEQQLTKDQLEQQKLLSIQQQQALRLNQQSLALSNKEKDLQRLAYLKEKAEKQEKEQALSLAAIDKQLQDVQLGALLQEKALQLKTLAEKNALIGFLLAGISAVLLAFAAFYWWIRQRQAKKEAATQAQFTRQLLEHVEDDRGRIAIDLHDSVSHELLLLKQSIRKEITGPEVGEKIDNIINGIRHISRNLHPVMLDKIGLGLSLETLCEQFMLHETMYVSHEIDYQNTLSKTAELQLFRIVQEGLTNALKYSKAQAVKVQLKHSGTSLQLEIQDNGKGFEVEKALEGGKAFGLHSIIQRAKAIGGKAEIKSGEGGTTVSVVIGV